MLLLYCLSIYRKSLVELYKVIKKNANSDMNNMYRYVHICKKISYRTSHSKKSYAFLSKQLMLFLLNIYKVKTLLPPNKISFISSNKVKCFFCLKCDD